MSDFDRALPYVLRFEGGFVDNPADPGGRTNRGITQRTYDAWLTAQGAPHRDVRDIKDSEVAAIYEGSYWQAGHCDALPWPLSLAHFDACVNAGIAQATKFLQRAAGVADDGQWGPDTADAAQNVRLSDLLLVRLKFYDALVMQKPALAQFFRGWCRRVLLLSGA